jgi:hypothetical protein
VTFESDGSPKHYEVLPERLEGNKHVAMMYRRRWRSLEKDPRLVEAEQAIYEHEGYLIRRIMVH